MSIAPGTVVDDKYEVIGSIGVGGMGVVYEAKQLRLDRLVALKLLSCMPSDAKEAVLRFEREAFVLSRLQHINIVQFYAYGLWQNFPYIVMERISGVSLQKKLAANEPLPSNRILDYAKQICDGLEHAHAYSVFHRDIKPSNIIISTTADGEDVVKLVDFGLAKLAGISVQKLTQTNMALGSVMYMSPEQCVGKGGDARSDIYSLGCLLYQCFTGEPPYLADTAVAVMFQQTNEPVEKCRGWPDLPEAVQSIIARCMCKDPAQRYESCCAVRNDLNRLWQVQLNATAPPVKARKNVSVFIGPPGLSVKLRNYFPVAVILFVSSLFAVSFFATKDHILTDKERMPMLPAVSDTPKETLVRIVRNYDDLGLDDTSARQLAEALHHCAQDAASAPDVLLAGYGHLVHYYQIRKQPVTKSSRTISSQRYSKKWRRCPNRPAYLTRRITGRLAIRQKSEIHFRLQSTCDGDMLSRRTETYHQRCGNAATVSDSSTFKVIEVTLCYLSFRTGLRLCKASIWRITAAAGA